MTNSRLRTLSITAALLSTLGIAVACTHNGKVGTSHEISHTESDRTGWFGGQYHDANTVYKNSDGSTSVETESSSSKNGTTTIVRQRKTTNLDGSVNIENDKRVVVRGSDRTVSESKTIN